MTMYQCSEKCSGRGSVVSDDYTFYPVGDNKQMEVKVGIVCCLFACFWIILLELKAAEYI